MARNVQNHVEELLPSSEEEEEEEEVKKTSLTTPPRVKRQEKTTTTQSSSSDSDPNLLNPITTSKRMQDPSTKKPRSKPNTSTPAISAKRPHESNSNRDTKKKKKTKKATDDDAEEDGVIEEVTVKKTGDGPKRQLFQRLWTDHDEIAVLKGMIDYTAKKGVHPAADMTAYHQFMKTRLHIETTKTQLYEKVRRLRMKYQNNATKVCTFSKPHDQQVYDLSNKIWFGTTPTQAAEAINNNNNNNVLVGLDTPNLNNNQRTSSMKLDQISSPHTHEGATNTEFEKNTTDPSSIRVNRGIRADSGLEELIIKEGIHLIEGAKRVELEEKWNQLRVENVELYLKRVELIREQTNLVLEALKSSNC